ncbi:ATP-binding protein [Prevotella copri]|uniref:ATP-binding protein n=1 Tax=Segatella copri TaxID=165179 RepID=A0AAW5IP12_9BACT|nr:AAA family ATPase [Segatella copri]MCP9535657.1 ATP-binding protein [Segatella copri]MCP9538578.1 ATP-binding protein [Segatella copri]MCP9541481.1 ATP-binding protein [Segatella copri]MCP9559832.1 ATP-binding protein [Segatella copri]MCP9562652.1 ATP-binding protein [Segatella copri]
MESKGKATPKEFSLSVIHILPNCSPNLKKGLRDEFYKLNGRCEINRNKVELREENPLQGFYGSRINVEAIVGVNGSGKSSLFEIIYRVINNLSCLLNRGKRRRTADDLYYVKDLYAELYYVVNGQLARISCLGDKVEFQMGKEASVTLTAVKDGMVSSEKVFMADFVKWAKENFFYTIVTNYSLQAFNANDYKRERCLILKDTLNDAMAETQAEGHVWMDSLFHKNDGYMTPIVLNPYRDEGVFDLNKEHHLTLYRLSAILIYAQVHDRRFMEDYDLDDILYTFDSSSLEKKYVEKYQVKFKVYDGYKCSPQQHNDIGTEILKCYGVMDGLIFDDTLQRTAAMYLIYKTFAIANSYPAYEEFSGLGELDKFTQEVEPETKELIYELVKTIKRDKSHISLKIRQTLHFLNALKKGTINSQTFLTRKISHQGYFLCVDEGKDLRSMRDIQEYLPPSFFQIEILVNRFENGERVNDTPIPIEQMSAGERQYLYTFSTYIYHVLNLLSIQESHRVRYRNINLILDEVEICFHPEFQRRFVYELLGYIKRLFMNRNASFNILIATHSPFILSDIPQSNILYLEDGKMVMPEGIKNPFAANICDILYQSFFLKQGFVGEFARKKIKHIIERLLPGDYFLDDSEAEYHLLMELIGDPFLKMQLQQLYEDRRKRNGKD